MAAPYSEDLRLRVMGAVGGGMTYAEVTRRFRVSNSTILRWVRRLRESGRYAALPMGGKKPFVLAEEQDWLMQRLQAKPDPRTVEATWRSVGTVLKRFTPDECQQYIKHSGYKST